MAQTSIIVIGASAGGVSALRFLTAALPEELAAAVLVVLHVGAHPSELPKILDEAGPLRAKHAEHGETISPGFIYVAPPDRHMVVEDGRLRLLRTPKENWARPAVDPLFRSAAAAFGSAVAGVILTGNLNDGTLGLLEIKRRGGIAIAQDPRDAAYPEMPASAALHVALDYCLSLEKMPELLIELANTKEAAMPITSSQPEPAKVMSSGHEFARPVAMTCPDCGGALQSSETGALLKYDCHIGHSYTAESMAAAQFDEVEKVLRAAVRVLNERAEFCVQMADHTHSTDPEASAAWHAAFRQALDRAYRLRDLIEEDWVLPVVSGCPPAAPRRQVKG